MIIYKKLLIGVFCSVLMPQCVCAFVQSINTTVDTSPARVKWQLIHTSPSSSEIKNAWNCIVTPPPHHVFIAWYKETTFYYHYYYHLIN
jgi:hypothetical protein